MGQATKNNRSKNAKRNAHTHKTNEKQQRKSKHYLSSRSNTKSVRLLMSQRPHELPNTETTTNIIKITTMRTIE